MVKKWIELSEEQQQKALDLFIGKSTKEEDKKYIQTFLSEGDFYFDSTGKAYTGVPVDYCPPGKYCSQPVYETTKLNVQKLISK